MKHFILGVGLVALAGCAAKPEVRDEPKEAFTCRGRPPPPRTSITQADAPVGRLELRRLPSESEPGVAPSSGEAEPVVTSEPSAGARLPTARFLLVAEAIPLGSLGAGLASELGLSVVVAAPLVELRVSLALPDTDVSRLLGLLRAHYGVGSTFTQGVLSLEEREELLQRLLLVEPAPLVTQLVPVGGLPAEQVAGAWCEQSASSRGIASVIGEDLLVKDSEPRIRMLRHMIDALRVRKPMEPPTVPAVELEPDLEGD
ncbi:hypothetical protein [Hyalangium rubrum]|uniref:NolW-like domain-containing protein n=1 Tax=Hyalangium rubrum TaxID=3103134 RepID=A0ABU5H4L1_9BACT|nr:hypothetical protein [Hyalangium sp. s54d21]MDY7227819.1 hypothetical protein [Hyalangium sp. s54d21]